MGRGANAMADALLGSDGDEQAQALGYHLEGLSAAAVVGGMDMGPQERWLRAGAAIIVATPGRLKDHLNRGTVSLRHVRTLVLDEADRELARKDVRRQARDFAAWLKKQKAIQ